MRHEGNDVVSEAREANGKGMEKEHAGRMMDKERVKGSLRWFFLDFDNYFAAVEQQENRHWRGRPVVVVPVDNTQATMVIAVSRQAKERGVRRGMTLARARLLCPGLRVAVARHDVYVRWHHRLLQEIERHLPIDMVHSVDEVSARLGRGQGEREEACRLAREVKRGLAGNVGEVLTCSIGLASSRLLAKVAAEMDKPDGLRALEPAELPEAIAHLPLRELPGISSGIEKRLAAAGIRDVVGLWRLAPRQARRVWGSVVGERFLRALRGEDVDPPLAGAPRSFGHGRVLAPEHREPEAAWPVACALLLKAAERMREAEMTARLVSLHVRWLREERWEGASPAGHGGRAAWQVPLEMATADSFRLVRALGEGWRLMRRAASRRRDCRLRDIHVWLARLEPERERQLDLFAGAEECWRARERLWAEIDRLNRRFGARTVVPATLQGLELRYLGGKIAFGRVPAP